MKYKMAIVNQNTFSTNPWNKLLYTNTRYALISSNQHRVNKECLKNIIALIAMSR